MEFRYSEDEENWQKAFDENSNLIEVEFEWRGRDEIPRSVKGLAMVNEDWKQIFGQNEIEFVEPLLSYEKPHRWTATRLLPPSTVTYSFVFDDGREDVCR